MREVPLVKLCQIEGGWKAFQWHGAEIEAIFKNEVATFKL